MRRIILCIAFLCPSFFCFQSYAQAPANVTVTPVKPDTLWRHGGFTSLSFNQSSFTNWAAGGQNSEGLSAVFSGFLCYKSKDSTLRWQNNIDLAYGMLIQGTQYRKTDDKIDIVSKLGKKAFDHVFYTLSGEFKSQFAQGYNYPNDTSVVSRFLAPGYVLLSLGMDWSVTSYFDLYLSPATGRITIVDDQNLADQGAYGVTPAVYKLDTAGNPTTTVIKHGQEVRFQFGASISAKFQKDIFKNINFKSKLDLFNDYTDPDASARKNIVVGWENDLVMKINKYFSASVLTDLIYDNDIPYVDAEGVKHGPRIQFEELLGIGFSTKF
jgi:hypothetical protein